MQRLVNTYVEKVSYKYFECQLKSGIPIEFYQNKEKGLLIRDAMQKTQQVFML